MYTLEYLTPSPVLQCPHQTTCKIYRALPTNFVYRLVLHTIPDLSPGTIGTSWGLSAFPDSTPGMTCGSEIDTRPPLTFLISCRQYFNLHFLVQLWQSKEIKQFLIIFFTYPLVYLINEWYFIFTWFSSVHKIQAIYMIICLSSGTLGPVCFIFRAQLAQVALELGLRLLAWPDCRVLFSFLPEASRAYPLSVRLSLGSICDGLSLHG